MTRKASTHGARFAALALVVAVVASAMAQGTAAGPSDEPLDVSELQYEPGNAQSSAFWMWVNVTDQGSDPVENVTASISGVQVMTPPASSIDVNPSLGRGASHSESFSVLPGASVTVTATITGRAGFATVRVRVDSPNGTTFNGGTGRTSTVSVSPADVDADWSGEWKATVTQVTGISAVTCSLSVSIGYSPASPTESLDNMSEGDTHAFGWMVRSASGSDPPASAVVVVKATVTPSDGPPEDLEYTAAFGKAVVSGGGAGGASDEPPLPPLDALSASLVVLLWLAVPAAAYLRLRGVPAPVGGGSFIQRILQRTFGTRDPNAPSTLGRAMLRKVPEITLYFWVIKVLCTTVGETAADALNGTGLANPMALGLSGTNLLMTALLLLALIFQFTYRQYIPAVYWVAVVLVSVVGTLITDHLHDDLGLGLDALTAVFAFVLALTFAVWYRSERTLSIHSIYTTRREGFYWAAILATFALGTAAGDLVLEKFTAAFGQIPSPDDPTVMVPLHAQAALLASAALFAAVIAACYFGWRYFKVNAVLAFWIAYIFTRPLGANIGDVLTLAPPDGGLGIDKMAVNLVFLAAIVASVAFLTVTKKDVFMGDTGREAAARAPWAGTSRAARPDD